jgi:hypothetical protein
MRTSLKVHKKYPNINYNGCLDKWANKLLNRKYYRKCGKQIPRVKVSLAIRHL